MGTLCAFDGYYGVVRVFHSTGAGHYSGLLCRSGAPVDQAPGGYTYQCDRVCGGVCLHGVFLCDPPGQHGPDPRGCPGGQRCGLFGRLLFCGTAPTFAGFTAATIWTTAAIGILCTLPKVLYAVIVAAVVVVMHLVLHPLSNKINKLRSYDDKSGPKMSVCTKSQ